MFWGERSAELFRKPDWDLERLQRHARMRCQIEMTIWTNVKNECRECSKIERAISILQKKMTQHDRSIVHELATDRVYGTTFARIGSISLSASARV